MKIENKYIAFILALLYLSVGVFSYGSELYESINYGDFTVENNTNIGLNLTVNGSITTETIYFEDNTTDHYIDENGTCIIINVGTTQHLICE